MLPEGVSRQWGGGTHIYGVYRQYIVQERERALTTLQEGAGAREQASKKERERVTLPVSGRESQQCQCDVAETELE